mgnify:CR=1 FL=1
MSRDVNNKYWDEELETLPRPELEKRQLADLQEIVQFAYDHAPYYKRSFDAAGVKPSDIKTLKDIQKFPFIDKKTQRDHAGGRFFSRRAVCRARGGRDLHFYLIRLHRGADHEPVYQKGL